MSNDSSNYAKTWELSVYELNRLPHEVITDDTEIAVSPRSLHNELMCPICLDILKSTMTTKECLHRFCHDCIITALRAGNKECPTCRKKLISKRSLRPDPNFDALIAKIYPNREEYDALHEKVLEKLNKKHLASQTSKQKNKNQKNNNNNNNNNDNSRNSLDINAENTNKNTDTNFKRQESNSDGNNNTVTNNNSTNATSSNSKVSHRKTRINSEESQLSLDCDATNNTATNAIANLNLNNQASTSNNNNNNNRNNHDSSRKRTMSEESDLESRTSTERSHLQNDLDEVELILKPHPKELTHNSNRFLKTTSNATIIHISKYLSMRLCIENSTSSSSSSSSSRLAANLNNNNSTDKMDFTIYVNINSTNCELNGTKSSSSSSSSTNTQTQATTTNIFESLNANITLENVIEKYWRLNKPLELFYAYKTTIVN